MKLISRIKNRQAILDYLTAFNNKKWFRKLLLTKENMCLFLNKPLEKREIIISLMTAVFFCFSVKASEAKILYIYIHCKTSLLLKLFLYMQITYILFTDYLILLYVFGSFNGVKTIYNGFYLIIYIQLNDHTGCQIIYRNFEITVWYVLLFHDIYRQMVIVEWLK